MNHTGSQATDGSSDCCYTENENAQIHSKKTSYPVTPISTISIVLTEKRESHVKSVGVGRYDKAKNTPVLTNQSLVKTHAALVRQVIDLHYVL